MRTTTCVTAALAGGLLLTACSDASEPLDPSAAIIQDKPLEGSYDVEVRKPLRFGCDKLGTEEENGDWTIELDATEDACLVAIIKDEMGVPASDGTVTWQLCVQKGRNPNKLAKAACERGGDGRWTTRDKGSPVNGEFIASLVFRPGQDGPFGFRYIYRGQGSGIANHTVEPFDVTRILLE